MYFKYLVIYIYESGEEDTNSKKLNLGLFQLEFIVSIQVNHLISLSSYNSLPKEEFWFWYSYLNSNLDYLFVINDENCFSNKM